MPQRAKLTLPEPVDPASGEAEGAPSDSFMLSDSNR